jgi:hypothetical protein
MLGDDPFQFATIVDRLFRDETSRREARLELRGVTRGAGTLDKAYEMLQESVSSTLCYKDEAIVLSTKRVRITEVIPKVANGFPAIVVRGAHGEASLHLTDELPGPCSGRVALN